MGGFVILSGDLKASVGRLNIAEENSVKYEYSVEYYSLEGGQDNLAPKFSWPQKSHACGIPYLGNSSFLYVLLAFVCSQGGVVHSFVFNRMSLLTAVVACEQEESKLS